MAETNQPFEVGAVVVLKSGGPPMTVTAIFADGDVAVAWQSELAGTSAHRFPPVCLRASNDG